MNETCTDCGAQATCQFDIGAGMKFACADHDPMRPPFGVSFRSNYYYRSLPVFPVLATTGHLGVRLPWANT